MPTNRYSRLMTLVTLFLLVWLISPSAAGALHAPLIEPRAIEALAQATPAPAATVPVAATVPAGATEAPVAMPSGMPRLPPIPTIPAKPSETPSPTPTPTITPTPTPTPRPVVTGLTLVPLSPRNSAALPGLAPNRGAVSGQVRDLSGQALWGQRIKVVGQGITEYYYADGSGTFNVYNLQPGTYTVTVENHTCTPAEGISVVAGRTTIVDFNEIRPAGAAIYAPQDAATVRASTTSTVRPGASSGQATAQPSPTPTPVAAFSPWDIGRWWNWLGFDVDFSQIGNHLYTGFLVGAAVVFVGLLVALVRR